MAKRPQVNTNIGQPEAIRTVARPSMDQAPVYSMQQSRAGALAQSLTAIAPSLNNFVEEFEQDYRVSEENRAQDEIQGMTYEQAKEAVNTGVLRDTESPWYQAAFEKQFGMVYANRRKRELVDAYNNDFDKHNGDIDQFIADFASSDLDKFGGSEFIMSGYRDAMKGVLPTLRDNHAEFKSDWTRERVGENFGSLVYTTVTDTLAEGGDLNAALNTLKAGHRESLGMTFKEMDASIFATAERLAAEGNVEALTALLEMEIEGPDGTVVGSYAARPQYATEAAKLIENAKATAGAAAREQNTATIVSLQTQASTGALNRELAMQMRDQQQISLGEYERLLQADEQAKIKATITARNTQQMDTIKTAALDAVVKGNGYAIQDFTYNTADGKTKTVTRDELVEGAVVDSMDALAKQGAAPALMAEQLSSYGVDVTYPVWEHVMSDGYLTLTENLSTGKDGNTKVPETALKGYATYKALADTPQLRSRHINNRDAEDVWATAYLLEQHGYDPQDALLRAAAPASDAGIAAANSFGREEFTLLANSVKGGMFGDDIANGAAALGQAEALAKFFISRGVPKKQAVKQAIKDYEDSHTVINGASVNTRNVHLPRNFEDASLVVLQEFAEMYDEDVDDLTMVPAHDGSNNWVVAYKGNVAMPVQVGGDNRIHISQIELTYKDAQERAAQAALDAAQAAINESTANAIEQDDMLGRRAVNQKRRNSSRSKRHKK